MPEISASPEPANLPAYAVGEAEPRQPRHLGMTPGALLVVFGIFVMLTATAAVAWPLLIYTSTLAIFGLAHVLSELRYVDSRFSPRLGWQLRIGLIGMLLAVVLVRVLFIMKMIDPGPRYVIELSLVAGLGAIVLPVLFRHGIIKGLIGTVVVMALGAGAVFAPLHTLLLLAVLHNLTPVGFLAERLRGAVRRGAMMLCLIVFVMIPMLIASGWPLAWLSFLGLHDPQLYVFASAGTLEHNLTAYLPRSIIDMDGDMAVSFFAAAVFLQCMHYFVVIHILPRLDSDGEWITPQNTVRWPSRTFFTMLMVAVGSVLLLMFFQSFSDARSVYSLIAAVHAWVEIPLLLLAMALPIEMFRTREPEAAAPVTD